MDIAVVASDIKHVQRDCFEVAVWAQKFQVCKLQETVFDQYFGQISMDLSLYVLPTPLK